MSFELRQRTFIKQSNNQTINQHVITYKGCHEYDSLWRLCWCNKQPAMITVKADHTYRYATNK